MPDTLAAPRTLTEWLEQRRQDPAVPAPSDIATARTLADEAFAAFRAAKAEGATPGIVLEHATIAKLLADNVVALDSAAAESDKILVDLDARRNPPPAPKAQDPETPPVDPPADPPADPPQDPPADPPADPPVTTDGLGDQNGGQPANSPTATVRAATAHWETLAGNGQVPGEPADIGQLLWEIGSGLAEGSVKIASMRYIDQEAPRLHPSNSAAENARILADATAALRTRNARTAAANPNAGFCGPAEYKRDIPHAGTDERPIAAAMRGMPIDGEIKHYRSNGLAAAAGASVIWTDAQQKLVDPDVSATWKPVLQFNCAAGEVTVTPYMTWSAFEYDNFQAISAPERVADFSKLVLEDYARLGDRLLWNNLITLGVTLGSNAAPVVYKLGARRNLNAVVNTILAHYGYANRVPMGDVNGWRPIVQYGFERALSIDRFNNRLGDSGMTR
ncbi:MAG: hypothetical protein ACRCZI_13225, partial [Cetobacterium sp.]